MYLSDHALSSDNTSYTSLINSSKPSEDMLELANERDNELW
jgi:hypothetical protein